MNQPRAAAALLALWAGLSLVVAAMLLGPVARIVAERRENLGLVAQGR
jgi:hypothetical protein